MSAHIIEMRPIEINTGPHTETLIYFHLQPKIYESNFVPLPPPSKRSSDLNFKDMC